MVLVAASCAPQTLVVARSRTLGFDPFRGYRRKERNVRDLRVREAIKEIAQLDGTRSLVVELTMSM